MSSVVRLDGSLGIANHGATPTALQRYRSERDAATMWIRQIQLNRVATKADWLEFSDRIRVAASRCFNAAVE
jgi:hypothetical protein